ncbi:hypothetical protein [Klebsiella aerogenes]|uniref:hypothetical protein n=1 Tax=Klebsiella aerogenes TaxID=548 RepID=UPI001F36B960|nr:hypothetical protein [Klebsiella aerogenes]
MRKHIVVLFFFTFKGCVFCFARTSSRVIIFSLLSGTPLHEFVSSLSVFMSSIAATTGIIDFYQNGISSGGRWQVAGGRWQVAGGRWQVAVAALCLAILSGLLTMPTFS